MTDFNKLKVDLSQERQVLNLTLNAPKGNVLDKEMMSELQKAIERKAAQSSVKAIVLRGEGAHFSFGASVPEHMKENVAEMLATFHDLLRALIATSKPMFALVRGQCLGGGLELAAFCHWIFAAEDAMFGQPEIKLAVFPPVASLVLPHRIGQSAADDLVLSGRSISAAAALHLGLVHSVSPDPEAELEKYISEHILPRSAAALHFAVKSSRYEFHRAFLQHIAEVEKMYVQDLMATDDANEGIAAFLEKRKPVWKNA
ncbi:MAG: enoyl-CoA hydratase-related protein [Calditrichaeota bacterium]|nr:enoyl-CoA hydratase-related protein [Calditrichota bacterium]